MTAAEYWFRLIIGAVWISLAYLAEHVAEHRGAYTILGICLLIMLLYWLGTDWDSKDFEGR